MSEHAQGQEMMYQEVPAVMDFVFEFICVLDIKARLWGDVNHRRCR